MENGTDCQVHGARSNIKVPGGGIMGHAEGVSQRVVLARWQSWSRRRRSRALWDSQLTMGPLCENANDFALAIMGRGRNHAIGLTPSHAQR
jgi:hypothetical protein